MAIYYGNCAKLHLLEMACQANFIIAIQWRSIKYYWAVKAPLEQSPEHYEVAHYEVAKMFINVVYVWIWFRVIPYVFACM